MNSSVGYPENFRVVRPWHQISAGLLLWMAFGTVGAADFFYTVQPGDNPWNLAQRYLHRPALGPRLSALNNIPDDHKILPGTRLRVPSEWLKLQTTQVILRTVYGDTTVTSANGQTQAARSSARLVAPVTLRTGATGSATLVFADGSQVLLRRESELQVKQAQQRALSQTNLVELFLVKGGLENRVIPMGDSGGRFEIYTPAAVAAVRGTEFRVQALPGELRTEVLRGHVGVANSGGQVDVATGQGSVAKAGRMAPSEPSSLLAAPNLDNLPAIIRHLPVDVALMPQAGAAAYRTQLALTTDFEAVISDETSSAPRIRARDVNDGNYVVRVRAIDAEGLEGFSSQREWVVHARPQAPILIEPNDGATIESLRPNFRWTAADPLLRYRWQVTPLPGTESLSEQVVASGVGATPTQDLPAGRYQWRVAAIDPVKGQGPWGDWQTFRRVSPGPRIEPPQIADSATLTTLRWSSQDAVTYRVQVSEDSNFNRLTLDAQIGQPYYELQNLVPGILHVRVQSISVDGYVGPWGQTQTFVVPPPPPKRWPALLLLIPLLGAL